VEVFHDHLAVWTGLVYPGLDKILIDRQTVPFFHPFQVITVRPLSWIEHQSIFHGVGVNVTAEVEQIHIISDRFGSKTMLK
jgi:hypothetical protein